MKRLGIPDRWIEHGSQKELYAECGFDDVALIAGVKEMLPVKLQGHLTSQSVCLP